MLCNTEKEARQIMSNGRAIICRNHTLFAAAFFNLQQKADRSLESPMVSDGITLYYHPEILCLWKEREGMEPIVNGILHIICHCILGHIMPRQCVEKQELYDALCDYKVYNLLSALMDDRKDKSNPLKKVKLDYPYLPLHMAYKQLYKEDKKAEKYLKIAPHCIVDNHDLWVRPEEKQDSESGLSWGRDREEENQASLQYEAAKKWSEMKEKMMNENFAMRNACDCVFTNDIGNHITLYDMDVESETDYQTILEDFLRKASVEVENHNAIDPMWYHFGLDYLENVPLIEPLEEEDRPSDGTLLIALDTSGSCEGTLCHRFLGELENLMTHFHTMDTLQRVVLLQCDAEIHEEVEITNPTEWSKMRKTFQMKGGGGTDFCPVFEKGEAYHDVLGLIYLSDGMGSFPQVPPTYPTLFLLTEAPDDDFFPHQLIPDWVEKAYFKIQ